MRKIVIGLFVSLVGLPVNAYFLDGNALISNMRDYEKAERSDQSTNFIRASEFQGYILGVFDILMLSGSVCSDDATKRQITAVVVKYLNNNPEKWNQPAGILVSEPLTITFPCSK